MGLKSKYTITTPSWVGKSNEIKYTTSTVDGVLIDLNSPQTSPTSTHKFVFQVYILLNTINNI